LGAQFAGLAGDTVTTLKAAWAASKLGHHVLGGLMDDKLDYHRAAGFADSTVLSVQNLNSGGVREVWMAQVQEAGGWSV
jgi:hypothetical protein